MMQTFGDWVRNRRERLGLNQTELAKRCDLPRTSINRIESGTTKLPTADFRRKLAAGLGVTHLDILVAAGELSPEEAEGIQPPTDPDEQRILEAFRSIPGRNAKDTRSVELQIERYGEMKAEMAALAGRRGEEN